jgi:hypothetical protein
MTKYLTQVICDDDSLVSETDELDSLTVAIEVVTTLLE